MLSESMCCLKKLKQKKGLGLPKVTQPAQSFATISIFCEHGVPSFPLPGEAWRQTFPANARLREVQKSPLHLCRRAQSICLFPQGLRQYWSYHCPVPASRIQTRGASSIV